MSGDPAGLWRCVDLSVNSKLWNCLLYYYTSNEGLHIQHVGLHTARCILCLLECFGATKLVYCTTNCTDHVAKIPAGFPILYKQRFSDLMS